MQTQEKLTHTVVTHVRNAYRKLDVHTAGGAVMRAIELGLIGAQRGSL